MERIDKILNHNLFNECIQKNNLAEADRSFCHHNMSHFLDVARIAMILNLEEHLEIPEDVVYATALLHDIGRFEQYQSNVAHEIASATIALPILQDCEFDDNETRVIIEAIRNHRNSEIKNDHNLNGILYQADKWSRPCFACEVNDKCNWKSDKKNGTIIK